MTNLIANVSKRMIQLALSLTSCPHIASVLEPLLTVILTLAVCRKRLFIRPTCRSRNGHHPESSVENLSAACSKTAYSRALRTPYFLYPVWLHFVVRPDQVNLLLHGFTGRIFPYSRKSLNVHAQLATLYPTPCALMLIMTVEGRPSVHLSICIQSGPHCLLSKIFSLHYTSHSTVFYV